MYFAYSLVLLAGFLLAVPWYALRGRATPGYLRTLPQRFGRVDAALNPRRERSIWVHAVSVGEVIAARPLLQRLKARFPALPLFLSTTTMTGQAVAQKTLGGTCGLLYVPYDFASAVRGTLRALDPAALLIVETEIWPNLIHEAKRRGTRIALVNGRISPRSFPRYRKLRPLLQHVLAEVDLFLMQAEPHADRVRAMGAPPERVRALGNLKFDAVAEPQPSASLRALLAGTQPLWVAGSTVTGEEQSVLDAFVEVRRSIPGVRLLLAPRHPERFAAAAELAARTGLRCVRRSSGAPFADADVLLLDTMGELAQAYTLATVVFVGGSLAPAGGHNVIEPAAAGRAVVVGPHMENFQEIADAFLAEGALVQIRDARELGPQTLALLQDEPRRNRIGASARALVESNRGALDRTVDAVAELLA